tara:strand:+ start:304 stop:894 length:591 start_codon:yes stop_codon:yes gene_type:complete
MKICFLGGTFDPPHMGHLKIALECLKQCQKFIFIPSKQSPHKKNPPSFDCSHRLKMLDMLASSYKNIEIDSFEIDSAKQISYTIDTIRYLVEKYKGASIYMVVGSDLINDIKLWKESEEIRKKVKIICFKRAGYNKIDFEDKNILFIDSINLNISSSSIKKEIPLNKSNRFSNLSNMIPKDIYDYIFKNKLDLELS